MSEPLWLTADQVIQINRRTVDATGEPHHLRSMDLLESALSRPQFSWSLAANEDVVSLASILLLAISRNHPFIQGNKRTAFVAMIGFLGVNGCAFNFQDVAESADYIVAAIEGRISDEDFTRAIRVGVQRVF